MSATIMIVEDESLVALELSRALTKEGYRVCDILDNGEDAITAALLHKPDLILMDINIKGSLNGIETARRLREMAAVPIIYLTAYADKKTVEEAVRTSPESYLIKPFKRDELYAALTLALFKNYAHEAVTLSSELTYDLQAKQLTFEGAPVKLTNNEHKLLNLMVRNQGNIVPFEMIEYEIWPDKMVSETTRRTLVNRLRSKLSNGCIETVPGIGFILNPSVDKML